MKVLKFLVISLLALPIIGCVSHKSNEENKSPMEALTDSLRASGDSIIMAVDTTGVVHIQKSGEEQTLRYSKIGGQATPESIKVNDYVVDNGSIIVIAPDGEKMLVAKLSLPELKGDTISKAEKISFTSARDSIRYEDGKRSRISDLQGKFAVEKEPGVTAAIKKESTRANNYTDMGNLWLFFYKKPIKFLGKDCKLTNWGGGKFTAMIETPDGIIAVKKNGDTYLNDEKIGTMKVSTNSKYIEGGMRYNVIYTTTGSFTGVNGEKDSFKVSMKSFAS